MNFIDLPWALKEWITRRMLELEEEEKEEEEEEECLFQCKTQK